jgi:hypothetical protein
MKIQIFKKFYMISILINYNYMIREHQVFPEIYTEIPENIRKEFLKVLEEGVINSQYCYNKTVDKYIQSMTTEILYTKEMFLIYLLLELLFENRLNNLGEYKIFFKENFFFIFDFLQKNDKCSKASLYKNLILFRKIIGYSLNLIIMSILSYLFYDVFRIIQNFSIICFLISFIIIILLINFLISFSSVFFLYIIYQKVSIEDILKEKLGKKDNIIFNPKSFLEQQRPQDLILKNLYEFIILLLMYIQYSNQQIREKNYYYYCHQFNLMHLIEKAKYSQDLIIMEKQKEQQEIPYNI